MNEWTEYHNKCEVSVGVIFNGLVNLFLITVVILLTFHPHPKTGLLHWLQSMSKKEISRNILTLASWVLQGDNMQ